MRVGRRRSDPEATFAVEGHLNGLLEVWEFFLGCEQLHLVAGRYLHLSDRRFAGQELGRVAVLHVGLEVRRHGRERERLAIVDRQVRPFPLGEAVDEVVAQGGHLAGLGYFRRVVLGAEGVVALAMGMHAIDDRIVSVPEEVLGLDGGIDEALVGFRGAGRRAVKTVGQQLSHLTVAAVGGGKSVDRIRRLRLSVGRQRRLEEVNVG